MKAIERGVEAVIFFSRWLMLPFFFGLIGGLVVLLYKFVVELFHLVQKLPAMSDSEVVIGVLSLTDFVLTANLILIVVFSGYENFVRKVDTAKHPDWPEAITKIDFTALKQKLVGSIVVIAAVEALEVYLNLEKITDTSKLGWLIGLQLTFVVSMLVLAIADRLSGKRAD